MGLYRRKDTKMWWMAFKDENGNYCQMSSETPDRKQAEKVLVKIQADVNDEKFLDKSKSKRYTFEDLFEEFLIRKYPDSFSEAIETVKAKNNSKDRLGDIISLAKKLARKNKRYLSKSCFNVTGFIKRLGTVFANLTLNQITSENISLYRDNRLNKDKKSPQTVKHEMNCLNHAFNLAMNEWGWIDKNPCLKVKKPVPAEIIKRVLNDNEEQRLLKAAQGRLGGQIAEIIMVGLHSGLREGDILNLKPQNVSVFEKSFSILQGKTKVHLTIPMDTVDDTLYDIFREKTKVANLSGYIFVNDKSKKIESSHFQHEFAKAREEAGIKDFLFKDLRRTFATRLHNKGVDIYTIMKLLGHQNVLTSQRYIGVSVESLRNNIRLTDRKQAQSG